jgi:flagellar L-ring protein FlgH
MSKQTRISVGMAAAVLLYACMTAWGQQTSNPAYTTSPQAAGESEGLGQSAQVPIGALVERAGGSLLRAEMAGQPKSGGLNPSSVSYYDVPEPKPQLLKKHDLVTIIIRENTQFASQGNTDLKHTNDLDAIIDAYVTLGYQKGLNLASHTPTNPIELKTSGQRDFNGDGQLGRQDTYTGQITAEVIDVKPNGTLVLQATEDIKTDEEEQHVTLIGTCRVQDITADNSVVSNQLFDLSLNKQHKGAIKDTTKRGFLTRLLDVINPF